MSNLKTVILTPEMLGPVKNGGIGTYITNFVRLLRQHGRDVTIVYAGPVFVPRTEWKSIYDSMGVPIIEVSMDDDYSIPHLGNWWFVQRSQRAAAAIPSDADIVYTQDWQANGFIFTRQRRFLHKLYPVLVNVFNSSNAWIREGMQEFPDDAYESLALEFAERYTARYSDFIAAPSAYVARWAKEDGWKLPPDDRVRVLGYPFMPDESLFNRVVQHAERFKRLVFFGRIETRKGIEVFVDALLQLKQQGTVLHEIEEIVLIGKQGDSHRFDTSEEIVALLQSELGIATKLLNNLDTYQAQQYLAAHSADTLVVIPSLTETLGFTVVESSLIRGLNMICSDRGGIPEVLGERGRDQLFTPYPKPLARKLTEWLERGPRPADELGCYDWQQRNQDWMNFHAEVEDFARCVQAQTPRMYSTPSGKKSVDICIPYYNHGKYLPQLLQALEWQTSQDFHVIVVNDASTDEDSVRVFEQMAERYHSHGWVFANNAENQGLSATRNTAVSLGQSEYVLFVDSDNVPLPKMVERFLTCIRQSDDDCLTAYMNAFEGDIPPYSLTKKNGQTEVIEQVERIYHYLPIGNSPELGVFTNPFGDANFIIRRSVFEQLGGFSLAQPHYRYIVGEDQELLTRLSLGGYRLDVIPEHLYYYRHLPQSLLRSTSHYQNVARSLVLYRDQLRSAGLEYLVPLIYGMHLRTQEIGNMNHLNARWLSGHVPILLMLNAIRLKIRKNLKKIPIVTKWI